MKCRELAQELKAMSKTEINPETTCDRFKSPGEDEEISKVAVSMFATPEVIKNAKAWGANFLIVHEPTYYNHLDTGEKVLETAKLKEKLILDSKIAIFRYHDYAHGCSPDLIAEGQLKYLGLPGKFSAGKYFAVNCFELETEITALSLAREIEKNLGVKHVRIAGNPQAKGVKIGCLFGTPGHVTEALEENDFVITGEICEWETGEIARDYAQLGFNKALLVLGHIGSERAGMMLLAERIKENHPEIETRYFECGEVYSYTD